MKQTTKAPEHLSAAGQRLYASIAATYDLAGDDAALALLKLACEAIDRGEQARQKIADEGAYLTGKGGRMYAHPAIAIERDSRLSAARLLRELGLSPDEASLDNNRPPRPGKR